MSGGRFQVQTHHEVEKVNLQSLFREKKLVLLVDLDLTLIHTSPVVANGANVEGIQPILADGSVRWLRLRPGAKDFLQNLSSLFEMYVCTKASADYARAVVQVLDPHRAIFKGRIISREYFSNPDFKTCILKRICHKGYQSMICIIDDNAFVWSNNLAIHPSLIKVPEYTFFNEDGSASVTAHKDDKDCYLQALEVALKEIHSEFFSQPKVNPVWTVIRAYMRKKGMDMLSKVNPKSRND